jgi:dTDP-4-amino-4,6-dideoxygalactose transaminase
MTNGNGKAIPFLDLVTPHVELGEELVSVFRTALKTAGFIGGPVVEEFEREYARFCGSEHCIGVASGTDAVRFALMAVGVQPGDTILTVPNTFIATTEAISQAGARPDFVDIDERTYLMDPRKLQKYLETQCRTDPATGKLVNRKTGCFVTGIVPVHLYGQMADMDAIQSLAERYRLVVVEDACQAHGASYYSRRENRSKQAGSMGRAAAFSFYPGKNLGACGEAGAVTTNDPEVSHKIRMLRDHGQVRKYGHEIEGYNGRLDAIQAGILRAKLKYLSQWNQQRRAIAQRYDDLFRSHADIVTVPSASPGSTSVYHLYVIRVKHRDDLQGCLGQANIATGIHYPTPLHLLKPYASLGYHEGDFPVAEKVAREILSLPMYPQLEQSSVERVAEKVIEFLEASTTSRQPTGVPLGSSVENRVAPTVLNS